jgi:uroporphyrinogen-III synthase
MTQRAVLITRHPADCKELQDLVRSSGITVRPFPVLRVGDVHDNEGWRWVRDLLADATGSPWLVMASPRAPERLVRQAHERGMVELLELPTAVVGDATARVALRAGLRVDIVGPGFGVGLATELLPRLELDAPIVLVCGEKHRPELPATLEAAGHRVQPLIVYAMFPTPHRELPPLGPNLEGVVLTSPHAARLYLDAVGGKPLPIQHWALGPTTQSAASDLGIDCRVPPRPTIQSLAEELCRT